MNARPDILLKALEMLLVPVVRFALRRGFRFQELNACLKNALLLCAEEDLKKKKLAYTISRASVVTGLQRKDIKRLNVGNDPRNTSNLLTRVIGIWDTNPLYRSRPGQTRDLTFEGTESEFAELVRSISADVSHYTVLFGLESSGSVERHKGKLRLVRRAYVPSENISEKLDMLCQDAEDLIRAVEENVFEQPETPHLHLTTVFDNICSDQLASVRDHILTLGSQFHEKLRRYLATLDKDSNPRLYKKEGGGRVVVGSFSMTEMSSDGEKDA